MKNGLVIENGIKCLYKNDILHREDGPSVEWDSYKSWHINGKLHRIDGPAIEFINGDKCWFYHGERINCTSTEEFLKIIKLKAFW
jgi:hypothetical protein